MLQNVKKFLEKDCRWILVLVIIIASVLRFWGASPGYPPYHSDEGIGYSSAVGMIKEGNLDPGGPGYPVGYGYPSVVPLVNFLFFQLLFIPIKWLSFYISNAGQIIDGFLHLPLTEEEYKRIFQLEILGIREIHALIWGRYVTALFGVGVVFLTYLLGNRFFNRRAGIVASILVAVNYRQVLNSHIGLPDIYNAFFLLLALFFVGTLLVSQSRKNYLTAGVSTALYFSTKFQFFAFLPFFLVHLVIAWKKRDFFNPNFFLGATMIPFTTILVNPYIIINFEKFQEIQSYQLLKYGIGTWQVTVFPFSYLFHIGLGAAISLLTIAGIFWALKRYTLITLIILTVVVQFFFVFTFYTRGGFYTRNFVTIIPILLLFAGLALERALSLLPKKVNFGFLIAASILISWTNIVNSVTAVRAYAQPWNFQVLSDWVLANIPGGSRVSAHSSVPLPIENVDRLSYDFHTSFSIEEFREDGAEYAIANLDWASNEFFWWMGGSWSQGPRYWIKPVDKLEQTYPAMALRELSDFGLHAALNPWQAPDSNFIIAKIPYYKISEKEQHQTLTFDKSELGWKSSPIEISSWEGIVVDSRLKTVSAKGEVRAGFVWVGFYSSLEDANDLRNRIAVRLTSRVHDTNILVNKEIVSKIPQGAKYIVVGFDSYSPVEGISTLDRVDIYRAKVDLIDEDKFSPVEINADVLFPFSQGGL